MSLKERIEKHHVESFLTTLNIPVQSIRQLEKDPPDFEITLDNKTISIEHTRLIKPKKKEREEFEKKIIEQAQILFNKKYPDLIYVLIDFDDTHLKRGRKAVQEYTHHIFDFVENLFLENKDQKFCISNDDYKEVDSPIISAYQIDNIQEFNNWGTFGAYLVPNIESTWLQNIVSKKSKSINQYRKHYDEHWLLLVSHLGSESSAFTTNPAEYKNIVSEFDKIFLFSYMAEHIERIK